MSEHVKNIINALDQDDNLEAETNFKAALTDKIGDVLDDRRKELAKTFVRTGETTDADSVQTDTESDSWKERRL